MIAVEPAALVPAPSHATHTALAPDACTMAFFHVFAGQLGASGRHRDVVGSHMRPLLQSSAALYVGHTDAAF